MVPVLDDGDDGSENRAGVDGALLVVAVVDDDVFPPNENPVDVDVDVAVVVVEVTADDGVPNVKPVKEDGVVVVVVVVDVVKDEAEVEALNENELPNEKPVDVTVVDGLLLLLPLPPNEKPVVDEGIDVVVVVVVVVGVVVDDDDVDDGGLPNVNAVEPPNEKPVDDVVVVELVADVADVP